MSIAVLFLQILSNIKLQHWYTTSYAQHIALDKLHGEVADLSDKFVEVFIGKYGRPKLAKKDLAVLLEVPSATGSVTYFNACIATMQALALDPKEDSDLINIRDELIAAFNQAKYLFTLT
jgi:hypothetical protein